MNVVRWDVGCGTGAMICETSSHGAHILKGSQEHLPIEPDKELVWVFG